MQVAYKDWAGEDSVPDSVSLTTIAEASISIAESLRDIVDVLQKKVIADKEECDEPTNY